MKKIEAIIRRTKFDDVKGRLVGGRHRVVLVL